MDGEPKEGDAMERKGNHAHRGPLALFGKVVNEGLILSRSGEYRRVAPQKCHLIIADLWDLNSNA